LIFFEMPSEKIGYRVLFNNIRQIFCTFKNLYLINSVGELYEHNFEENRELRNNLNIENIKGLHETSANLFFLHGNKISIIANELRTIFQSDNMRYITAGREHLLIQTDDHHIYCLYHDQYDFFENEQFLYMPLLSEDKHILE